MQTLRIDLADHQRMVEVTDESNAVFCGLILKQTDIKARQRDGFDLWCNSSAKHECQVGALVSKKVNSRSRSYVSRNLGGVPRDLDFAGSARINDRFHSRCHARS